MTKHRKESSLHDKELCTGTPCETPARQRGKNGPRQFGPGVAAFTGGAVISGK